MYPLLLLTLPLPDRIMAPNPSRPSEAQGDAHLGTPTTTMVAELGRVGKDGHTAIDWLRCLLSVIAEVHKDIFVNNKDDGDKELTMMARNISGREQLVALNSAGHIRYVALYDRMLVRISGNGLPPSRRGAPQMDGKRCPHTPSGNAPQ